MYTPGHKERLMREQERYEKQLRRDPATQKGGKTAGDSAEKGLSTGGLEDEAFAATQTENALGSMSGPSYHHDREHGGPGPSGIQGAPASDKVVVIRDSVSAEPPTKQAPTQEQTPVERQELTMDSSEGISNKHRMWCNYRMLGGPTTGSGDLPFDVFASVVSEDDAAKGIFTNEVNLALIAAEEEAAKKAESTVPAKTAVASRSTDVFDELCKKILSTTPKTPSVRLPGHPPVPSILPAMRDKILNLLARRQTSSEPAKFERLIKEQIQVQKTELDKYWSSWLSELSRERIEAERDGGGPAALASAQEKIEGVQKMEVEREEQLKQLLALT